MKYKAEKEAEAQLIRRQREAEAQKYEALQQAEARKAEAEALRFPWSRRQRASGPRVWPRQRPLRRRQKPKSEWVKPPFWKCTWQPCRKWSKTPPPPLPDGKDRHVRRRQLHQAGSGHHCQRQSGGRRHEGVHRNRPASLDRRFCWWQSRPGRQKLDSQSSQRHPGIERLLNPRMCFLFHRV